MMPGTMKLPTLTGVVEFEIDKITHYDLAYGFPSDNTPVPPHNMSMVVYEIDKHSDPEVYIKLPFDVLKALVDAARSEPVCPSCGGVSLNVDVAVENGSLLFECLKCETSGFRFNTKNLLEWMDLLTVLKATLHSRAVMWKLLKENK